MIKNRKNLQRETKEGFRKTGSERRIQNRRQASCRGYAYITMVGWMDRRENRRRAGDPLEF